jgi:membrane protein DedA with SNARE-associated domain
LQFITATIGIVDARTPSAANTPDSKAAGPAVIDFQDRRIRRTALLIFVLALLPALICGVRTYRTFLLLRSAYEMGAPMTSSIRGWMTLDYVAANYRTPQLVLIERLGLAPATDGGTSLRTLAERAGVSPPDYVQRVQRAVADIAPRSGPAAASDDSGWLAAVGDKILTALLLYGYPVLGATLLLGAIGLPLPNGIAAAAAGSLAAQGRMNWLWAGIVIVVASALGDLVGYTIGRLLGGEVLQRHARWFGFSPARRARAQALFNQWGLLMVFITRTFVSYLSSVASLLAGAAGYQAAKFIAVAVAGRIVWAAAYLALGYAVGSDLEAAAGFLTNLSLLLLMLIVLAGSGLVAIGRVPAAPQRI